MNESRPKKHKIEFIESYWTGGEFGSDYVHITVKRKKVGEVGK